MQFILSGHLHSREDFSGLEVPIFPDGVCVCCVTAGLSMAPVLCMGTHFTLSQCICDLKSLTPPV